jgi:hypothetical protein
VAFHVLGRLLKENTLLKAVSVVFLLLGAATFAVALPPPVPEIDAGSASNAVAAVIGVGLLIRSRRKA